MKRVSLCTVLILMALCSQAQIKFVVTGGFHSATVSPAYLTYPDTAINSSAKKTSSAIGFTAELPLSKRVIFRTGIIRVTKGADYGQRYDTTNLYNRTKNAFGDKKKLLFFANNTLDLTYIEIPFNVQYALPLNAKASFFIGAGPRLSMHVKGTSSYKTTWVSQEDPNLDAEAEYSNEVNKDLPVGAATNKFRAGHLSMDAYGGIEVGRVRLAVNYNKDITRFYQEENRDYKFTTIGASLGVMLFSK